MPSKINSINPFNDPEFKKQILEKEGRVVSDAADYEIIQPEEDVSKDLKSIISGAPKIPGQVKNVILDASAIAKNEKDKKAAEINLALNDIFTKYNKEYGTDLQVNFSSLSQTLVNVSDPHSRHILELFVSEVFQSIRPILILHMISKLTVAIDYILDPQRMFGGDMTIQDTFIAVEKIMQFIQQLEDMRQDVVIKGSDVELRKIADDITSSELDDSDSRKVIDEFMNLFKKDSEIK